MEPISKLEIYLALKKYYNYVWNLMHSKWFFPSDPNAWQYPSLRYACTTTAHRSWRAEAHAYALYKGVWYAAYAGGPDRQNGLNCG